MQGKIIKGIAGFYYVNSEESGIYACKARGLFRKENKKPLVGDNVTFSVTDETDREGSISVLHERKNELPRPMCANIDQALILFASKDPKISRLLLDRMLVNMEQNDIPIILCMNKQDLAKEDEMNRLKEVYEDCGYRVLFTSAVTGQGISELRECLRGKTTVVTGPSGVGKSSVTNLMSDMAVMEVGSISRKLARGKNTTRHAELIPLQCGGYLMDTPGFSAVDLADIEKERLRFHFPEMLPYEGKCRFNGCLHLAEPDCAVKRAVEDGKIDPVRYEDYGILYEELKEREKRRY
ncbi:MAG: ribosome small subunit-dependent GTPase A [Lachnospiraceae bacterium]|nr:ribosome small subunit-dependent GTPase A [Lachnospiraceae bacterium]